MLIPSATLVAIRDGRVDLAFRRWKSARVRAGTRFRTGIGLVEVVDIAKVDPVDIGDADARRAGYPDRAALIVQLDRVGEGEVYRIGLRYAGADPRIALRSAVPDAAEVAGVVRRLEKMDLRRKGAPWTRDILATIAERPAVRAAELAGVLGRDVPSFKADVRKLKELGLTESLEIGYRLSPRGEAVLAGTVAGRNGRDETG